MKTKHSMMIDLSLFVIFDEEIEKIPMKRSTALSVLIKHFNNEISVDNQKLKEFVLSSVFPVSEYGRFKKKFSLSVDEDEFSQFFKTLGSMKQKNALEKLITYFLNLSDDEKYNVLFR